MSSFEEFVIEKKCLVWIKPLKEMGLKVKIGQEGIRLKDLGEWAWIKFVEYHDKLLMDTETYIEIIERNLSTEARKEINPSVEEVFFDIAVSCLGEIEVKKRLEELK